MSFFFWFLQLHIQGLIFKWTRNANAPHMKLFNNMGVMGSVLAWCVVSFFFNHNGAFFQILDTDACFMHLAKFNYVPQIILVLATVIFSLIKPPKEHRPKPQD